LPILVRYWSDEGEIMIQNPARLPRRPNSICSLFLGLLIAVLIPQSAGVGETKIDKSSVAPANEILSKWTGTWNVKAVRHQPQPGTSEYRETYEWRLDDRFLYGETSRKTEGTKSISLATYDVTAKAFRFWFFDSTGFAVELPNGTWNETTQTMLVETGAFSPVRYSSSVRFVNPDTIVWSALLKDWKGAVALHLEGTNTRLPPR
jgi:uncharacterized protein DUF1579